MSYAEKLCDPRWQRKRLEILDRDKFSCQHCGDKTTELHVHHLIYFPGKQLWDYPDNCLSTLCANCHKDKSLLAHWEQLIQLCDGRIDGVTLRDFLIDLDLYCEDRGIGLGETLNRLAIRFSFLLNGEPVNAEGMVE